MVKSSKNILNQEVSDSYVYQITKALLLLGKGSIAAINAYDDEKLTVKGKKSPDIYLKYAVNITSRKSVFDPVFNFTGEAL